MAPESVLCLVPLVPLVGALVVYLVTSVNLRDADAFSGWFATVFSVVSFVLSLNLFVHILGAQVDGEAEVVLANAWSWIAVGDFKVDFALRYDNLSAVMSLIITGVGSLIHLYAIGYMKDDPERPRFFCYLNLFLFAMLLLVLGDNLLVMFVGWEGVGLCSYLLIGFWHREMVNAEAGQKAFVVNRIGDAGFLLGMFLVYVFFGTLSFSELQSSPAVVDTQMINVIALLLFIGAVGKSAQIPLFVWLPDAMAGPTPVSALIHAATMVTAGVYMVTRMGFLYAQAEVALAVMLVVGTLTALVAASIALVQNDIKKVLAYSTVSQLGYMFMALGAGAFSNGIYHVITHAFFKACLFMAAGSVIIGCHHEQDMRQFGGLWKKMPITCVCYLLATLAIAGFPGFSGFYSKDAILWTVFSAPGLASKEAIFRHASLAQFCWAVGLVTAFLTAFYMTRSLMLTFFGKYRGHAHPHESSLVVTAPIGILAILSVIGVDGDLVLQFLGFWTRGDMLGGHAALAGNPAYHVLERIAVVVALSGMALSWLFYGPFARIPRLVSEMLPNFYRLFSHKWYVDEVYEACVVAPLRVFSQAMFRGIDREVIDATVDGTGALAEVSGEVLRSAHSGRMGVYAAWMFAATLFFTVFYLVMGR